MSEHEAALAHTAMAAAAVVAKPRISADAFRNLTARLKKSDVAIPSLMPAPVPVVKPAVVVEALAPEITPQPATAFHIEPVVVSETPSLDLDRIEPAPEPAPLSVLPLAMQPEPTIDVAPATLPPIQQAPEVLLEDLLPSASTHELSIEAVPAARPHEQPAAEVLLEDLLPLSSEAEAFIAPSDELVMPPRPPVVLAVEPVSEATFAPRSEPRPKVIVEFEPAFEAALVPEVAVAEAQPVEVAVVEQPAVAITEPAAAEPQLEGGFAENFTYVPEGGKPAPEATPATSDAQIESSGAVGGKDVADRAIQLQLENNWRLLLAKPTAEDRATYLREAAEYHEFDEEWNKPAPEHDLSRIEPARIEDEAVLVEAPESPGAMQRSLQDNLPVAEGQDLAELTRSLLDMMAAGNASGLPQERALAADTLLRLVPRLDLKPLVMLAQRLSIMDNPPHLLAARLIRDPRVEVSGPLLEECSHLTDRDIETVVEEGETAKLRMIARRRKLTRPISDALIKSGDPSVVLTLVRNKEAEISHAGFQSLLVLCENHEELLAPLATRQDMQAPFAFELFWLAPAQLRRFILSRFLTDSETLTKILKITMATQSEDDGEAEPLSQHALLEALERAARGHVEVAADELASIMQLSSATVAKILGDLQGDAIVVMLKAAGYPRSAVMGLLKRMQDADLPLVTRERDISELQSMFETLSFNKARILLTYWDWAQGKTGPYAPVN